MKIDKIVRYYLHKIKILKNYKFNNNYIFIRINKMISIIY